MSGPDKKNHATSERNCYLKKKGKKATQKVRVLFGGAILQHNCFWPVSPDLSCFRIAYFFVNTDQQGIFLRRIKRKNPVDDEEKCDAQLLLLGFSLLLIVMTPNCIAKSELKNADVSSFFTLLALLWANVSCCFYVCSWPGQNVAASDTRYYCYIWANFFIFGCSRLTHIFCHCMSSIRLDLTLWFPKVIILGKNYNDCSSLCGPFFLLF